MVIYCLDFMTFYLQFFSPTVARILMATIALCSAATPPQLLAAHCMWGSEHKAQLLPQVPYGAQKPHDIMYPDLYLVRSKNNKNNKNKQTNASKWRHNKCPSKNCHENWLLVSCLQVLFGGCYWFLCILCPQWYNLSVTKQQTDTNGA